METTKTSNFTCQSKSFISIFFTCQVSACELLPFFCHDLANDTYPQTAKTVFSHLNCSCKLGYSGNGHNCSGGCLRSFIYLLRLANPCWVTVTTVTELLGPVTVPSLMRLIDHHTGTTSPTIYEQYVGSLSSQRNCLCKGSETGTTIYRPYPRRLQSLTICRFLHRVFFCICLPSSFEYFRL